MYSGRHRLLKNEATVFFVIVVFYVLGVTDETVAASEVGNDIPHDATKAEPQAFDSMNISFD